MKKVKAIVDNYYQNELSKIKTFKNVTIKIYARGCDIKELNLNLESIRDFRDMLNKAEAEFINEKAGK
jgi:hypothetical protein